MEMTRTWLVATVIFALSTMACTSQGSRATSAATSAPPAAAAAPVVDVNALAGKWHGWWTDRSGRTFPLQVEVDPNGTYQSRIGTASGAGEFKVADGKVLTTGHLNGPSEPISDRMSVARLVMKDGQRMLVGEGRSELGPYSYELVKD